MNWWKSSSLVWLGTLAAAALAFGVQVILARRLSIDAFGAVTNGYAIASLVGIFGFQGIGEVLMRHPSGLGGRPVLGAFAGLFGLALLLAVGLVAWTRPAGVDPLLLLAFVPFAVVHVGLLAGMVDSQMSHRPVGMALWPSILQVGRLLPLPLVFWLADTDLAIPLAWSATLLIPAVVGGRRIWRRLVPAESIVDDAPRDTRATARSAMPFAVGRVLEFAEIQLPTILAALVLGAHAAGLVAASTTLVQCFLLLPLALFQRLLRPRFHEWARHDPRRLRRVALLGGLAMFAFGAVVAVLGRPFGGDLLRLVYGDDFAPATAFLSALLLLLPIWLASIAVNAALVSPRAAVRRTTVQMIGIALLVGCAILIRNGTALDGILFGVIANQVVLLVGGLVILLGDSREGTPRTGA